jgi:hypothetical protein
MNVNCDWQRRLPVQHLPSIKDEDIPNKIQDFYEALNLPTSNDKSLGPLEVRAWNNVYREQNLEERKRTLNRTSPFSFNRRIHGSAGLSSRKNIPSYRRSYSLSGRKREPRENAWNYRQEIIDLSVVEDVEKLALKLFTKELKEEGETLEKTIERIYGGVDADRCVEFTSVGNCGPFSTQQKVNVFKTMTLPDIAKSKEAPVNNGRGRDRNPKIELPSIFEVFYSSPVSFQAIKSNSDDIVKARTSRRT